MSAANQLDALFASLVSRPQNDATSSLLLEMYLSTAASTSDGKGVLSAMAFQMLGNSRMREIGRTLMEIASEESVSESSDLEEILGQRTRLIVTPKPTELSAVAAVFGIDLQKEARRLENGTPVWSFSYSGLPYNLACVGKERNISSNSFTSMLIREIKPRSAFLIGMAASAHPEKVRLKDVVVASSVWDYEPSAITPEGSVPQPQVISSREDPVSNSSLIEFRKPGWAETLSALAKTANQDNPATPSSPSIHTGVIASGDKLAEDGGKLAQSLRQEASRKIRALDMDSAGFAQACANAGLDWFVFRGISDAGEKDRVQDAQWVATASAALAFRASLDLGIFPQNL